MMPLTRMKMDCDDIRWLDFINQHPDSTIFHHPRWLKVITTCYGYQPFILGLVDQQGVLNAGMPVVEINNLLQPKRWVSLPFTDVCEPLAHDPALLDNLEDYLVDESMRQGVKALEVRSSVFMKRLSAGKEYIQSSITLSDSLTDVQGNVKGANLRKLRQAERHQVEICITTTEEMMNEFYRLHVETRHRHGLPVQPKCFFDLLQREIIANGLGFLTLARVGSEFVAGGAFLFWKGVLHYKYAASNLVGRSCYASDPLIWQAIQWGIEHQASKFDWGRTDLEDAGLRRFKNRWGSVEHPLIYASTRVEQTKSNPPIWMGWIRKCITSSPVEVSRWSGELFYRYFG